MEDDGTAKASVAATKIQANFRGYCVRKRLENLRKGEQLKCLDNREKSKRHRSEEKEERSSILNEQKTTRESLEEKSAVIIQARVRGFLVRKRQPIRFDRPRAEFNQQDDSQSEG
ncbi:hypothetical protein WH47_04802 [Habropoda laboriosa]|uniref:Abnormal spindle-like microcephaly-associated protein like protein n=1 Tax=Habropoda laboriosa TaxID=597456 RepID=A0A0L7QXM5_9HYME|nr:hypothetical protein WH47_04802 [Habropoda laboriosa]